MKPCVEKTFKKADEVARLLGDLKYGIYELKIHGGISEADRLDILDGFVTQAYEMLAGLREVIEQARKEVRA